MLRVGSDEFCILALTALSLNYIFCAFYFLFSSRVWKNACFKFPVNLIRRYFPDLIFN